MISCQALVVNRAGGLVDDMSGCRKGATVVMRGDDYVVGGVNKGVAVATCGTHRAAVERGNGIWARVGILDLWFARGRLKYEGEKPQVRVEFRLPKP